jgi:hypothetical protein
MAFATVAAIAGLGAAAYGASQQSKSVKKANKAAKKANAQQQLVQEQTQIASEASIRAEALREKQMELEGIRRRRDIIRMAQASQSLSVARSVAQGAQQSSSARAGRNQISSQARVDTLANTQNIMIGRGIFEENRNITQAQAQGAQFQSNANIFSSQQQQYMNQASYGQQLVGFGLGIAQNAVTAGNVATTIWGSPAIGNWNTTVNPTVNWANI